jgi:hypothetical protein
MKTKVNLFHIISALIFGLFIALSSNAAETEDKALQVVVINTFDVGADGKGFLALIDKSIKIAKGLDVGEHKSVVIAKNVATSSASSYMVVTTYPNLEEYAKSQSAMKGAPELKESRRAISQAGYKLIDRSIGAIAAEY